MRLPALLKHHPVLPIVAKIVFIDELAHLTNQHGRQFDTFLIDQLSIAKGIWFTVTVIADMELVEMVIGPAHGTLYSAMQFGQGDGGRHQQAAPYHGLDAR